MRAEYDFSKRERKALIPSRGKTRISIFIDNAVLDEFRARAEVQGSGYQTMMNEALKAYLSQGDQPLTESKLRAVLKEVLPAKRAVLTSRSTRTRAKARAG